MKAHVLYGPPGTGKTTELLRILGDVLKRPQYPESSVCFLSHTKAAAREAAERAGSSNVTTATIHSLCYRACGFTREQVVSYDRLADFARITGFKITGQQQDGERQLEEGDEYLSLLSLAVNLRVDPAEVYDRSHHPGTYINFDAFVREYRRWKDKYGYVDFNDMLLAFVASKPDLGFKVVIVDEAQDLSPLQWEVVDHLVSLAALSYIAGDDDQAIFVWGGADPAGMEKFEQRSSAKRKVLSQSYRVPVAMHTLASGILSRIQHRVLKDYLPRPEKGKIVRSMSLSAIQTSKVIPQKGHALVLYRDLLGRQDAQEWLMSCCLPFTARTGRPAPYDSKWGKSVRILHQLQSGQEHLSYNEVRSLGASGNAHCKRLVENRDINKLRASKWQDLIDVPQNYYHYFNNADLISKPKIELSTIHGVKGHEAERVILLGTMSQRTSDTLFNEPDQEHRVWYVGVTRAINSLMLVEGQNGYVFPLTT